MDAAVLAAGGAVGQAPGARGRVGPRFAPSHLDNRAAVLAGPTPARRDPFTDPSSAAVAAKMRPLCATANEQNLDRLAALLDGGEA